MSLRLDWQTPKELYKKLDKKYHFDFDPCPHNPTFDGLNIIWGTSNFVNPPYGHEISNWLKKGYEESLNGKTVVFLIPSRTDTKWWHDYVMKAKYIHFIKGRLKFDDGKNPAPFPSCVVIFNHKKIHNQKLLCEDIS
ncbi:MAG TPA: DNA N-6-adenine-methyltransferase [Candidatus Thermoplasmatota archaeon]|nr:DNA N-6-adenine-methyltransferase [Candidatus Thermoplasmatota archaeon]